VRGGIRAENYVNAQMLTTVAPETRAAQLLSFDETKAELTSLAKQSERIVQITNKAGRDECHSSLMVLKSRRVDIEKRGKEARDDANKFAKAVIAKEKELIGFIAPEEERLQLLRDQWDTAAEVARLEKLEAERLRVEAIQKKIQQIRDVPGSLVGKPSIIISGQLAELRKTALDEDELGADYLTATDALTAAISRVEQLLAAQQEADAEKKRQAERDA
jgi:colicin import membrane protein